MLIVTTEKKMCTQISLDDLNDHSIIHTDVWAYDFLHILYYHMNDSVLVNTISQALKYKWLHLSKLCLLLSHTHKCVGRYCREVVFIITATHFNNWCIIHKSLARVSHLSLNLTGAKYDRAWRLKTNLVYWLDTNSLENICHFRS